MKAPALVAVAHDPEAFAPLFAFARARGARIGWLDFVAGSEPSIIVESSELASLFRTVTVSPGRLVATKRLPGAPVLRDLLREYFLGCGVVLVRGRPGFPSLAPDGELFRLRFAPERELRLGGEELLRQLLRPRSRA